MAAPDEKQMILVRPHCQDVAHNKDKSCDQEEVSDEYVERGNWSGKFDFLLSLLGYSVGLGNVWRFPYLAYNNGGGAFVIPFLVMLLLVGFPLMFMELSFGQYASLGPIAIFDRFCPLFHGVGCGMIIVSSLVALYYNMIIAWTCFYMFASFTTELPWERCHLEWSTHECYSYKDAVTCLQNNGSLYFNRTCFNESMVAKYNISELVKTMTKKPPAEEYFEYSDQTIGIKEVVYFTALFPYVVLIILFFRGVTLPGAKEGIIYYLTPDFSRLKTSKVGAGLAFIVYPEVVTRLPVSPLWSFMFFLMLLTLGLDSQFALMETVTTATLDRFPNLREKKVWVVLGMSIIGYCGGLTFCFQYRPMTLGSYVYPLWANVLGWIVAVAPVIAVPLVMIYKICSAPAELTFVKKVQFLLNPTSEWGPAHKVSELNLDSTPLKNQPGFGDRRYDLNPIYPGGDTYRDTSTPIVNNKSSPPMETTTTTTTITTTTGVHHNVISERGVPPADTAVSSLIRTTVAVTTSPLERVVAPDNTSAAGRVVTEQSYDNNTAGTVNNDN
ncbi:hypothetical protein LSH36_20g15015 [Paralvinella palmiformis]|uniref:Transporter n=1 Tax=Paralvinella palmiformis TaxID=53620 RepID=A0AAD9NH74_9ANNE|nr:hypothetical protein LSH36_20g15015 [Paralvinella palmiformis]